MRRACINYAVKVCKAYTAMKSSFPFAYMTSIICKAIEADSIVPSQLKKALKDEGLQVKYTDGEKGSYAEVSGKVEALSKKGHLGAADYITCMERDPAAKLDSSAELVIASGYSDTDDDALLQAVYAELVFEATKMNYSPTAIDKILKEIEDGANPAKQTN